jgi:hypothetical protein
MHKPGRRTLIAALIGIFVLASLAVAAASGNLGGGDDDFQVDSAEPSSTGDPTGEGNAGAPEPSLVDPPAAGGGSGSGGNASSPVGPDTPVSSDDTPRPALTVIVDPPSAFSGIRNFEQCAAAGYPVMESYPEQCRTPDGRLFVRVID